MDGECIQTVLEPEGTSVPKFKLLFESLFEVTATPEYIAWETYCSEINGWGTVAIV